MDSKGRIFKGVSAGKSYDLLAPLFGLSKKFFENATTGITVNHGMHILDLGCGTGKFLFALAGRAPEDVSFYGCDYSPEQLEFAERIKGRFPQKISFIHASMDELDFPDEHFDIIMSSMALHAVNPQIRRSAVREISRMLKKGGKFLLVESAKPRFGIVSLLLGCLHRKSGYNPDMVYGFCRNYGLELTEESYLNSLVKRQIFVKKSTDS